MAFDPFVFHKSEPPAVGAAILQVVLIASLCGPFFVFGGSVFETGMRVIALYLFFEVTRRTSEYLYTRVMADYSTIRSFPEGKRECDWIMAFLAEETRLFPKSFDNGASADVAELLPAGKARKLRWGGSCIEVTRTEFEEPSYRKDNARFKIDIKVCSLKSSAMSALLDEAKKRFMNAKCPDLVVHSMKHSTGSFSITPTWSEKRRQAGSSLTLPIPGSEFDSLVHDAREFFDSSEWYAAAGVPWHKTYLLHGPQGTCPANIVFVLGAKLRREVYYLNLVSPDFALNNATIMQAMSNVPKDSIVVIENMDQPFSLTNPPADYSPPYTNPYDIQSTVTPAGIWDILHSYSRVQGILVFGTATSTDRFTKEFPELSIDKPVECKYASKEQIAAVFNRFFPTSHGIPESAKGETFPNDAKASLLSDLADVFASYIPEDEFSILAIQRYLVPHRTSPIAAISGIKKWVDDKLEEKRVKCELEDKSRAEAINPPRCTGPCCRHRSYPYTPPKQWGFPAPWAAVPFKDPKKDDYDKSTVGDTDEQKPAKIDLAATKDVDASSAPVKTIAPTVNEPSVKPVEMIALVDSDPASIESNVPAKSDMYEHLPELHRRIASFIRNQVKPTNSVGIHVTLIAKEMAKDGTDALSMSDALEKLIDDGLIYTTVDDTHFMVS